MSWRETLVGRVVGPIRFHTYDQTDAVLFFDSPENVSPRYRQHLVPSGNVLRFFGATEHGYSICVNVFGQRSYFYCEYSDTDRLREVIASVGELVPEPRTPYAVSVTPATKTSIYGYGTRPVPDLQCVSISNWTMARKNRRVSAGAGFSRVRGPCGSADAFGHRSADHHVRLVLRESLRLAAAGSRVDL